MSAHTEAAALASALRSLVAEDLDVADVLARLVGDCADVTGAGAVALLAQDVENQLALLTATSHQASEIEMLQIQASAGPCVDCIRTRAVVTVSGVEELVRRWGQVGEGIRDAGFAAAEAYPMRWHGITFGGLNIFHADPAPAPRLELGQAFADVATLVIVQTVAVSREQVRARLHEAITARELVEQAKGVLAYRRELDMGAAYAELLRRCRVSGATLTQVARDVLDEARTGSTGAT